MSTHSRDALRLASGLAMAATLPAALVVATVAPESLLDETFIALHEYATTSTLED